MKKTVGVLQGVVEKESPDKLMGLNKVYQQRGIIPFLSVLSATTETPFCILEEPRFRQWSLHCQRPTEEEKILFIEDVTDTGYTMYRALKNFIEQYYRKGRIKVVPLYDRGYNANEKIESLNVGFEPIVTFDDISEELDIEPDPRGITAGMVKAIRGLKNRYGL